MELKETKELLDFVDHLDDQVPEQTRDTCQLHYMEHSVLHTSSPGPAGPPGFVGDTGEEGPEGFSYGGDPGTVTRDKVCVHK